MLTILSLSVFRHADRTPKQKLKFNFPVAESWTAPFVRLLNGENDEIILREANQLKLISAAVEEAKELGAGGDDLAKLTQLNNALFSKIDLPGTKAQLKPGFKKGKNTTGLPRKLEKLQLVFKWGGEVRSGPCLFVLFRLGLVLLAEFPFAIIFSSSRTPLGTNHATSART